METILVVGGAGYIGSHTVLELAKSGNYKIVIFDNLANGHREAVDIIEQHTGADIELVQGDLLNPAEITAVFNGRDIAAVIHFAALIEAGVSMQHPTRFFGTNVAGSINLFKAMQAANVRKLVFSSTGSLYGTQDQEKCSEDMQAKPESYYAASKYMVEQILASLVSANADASERINSVILRYFNAAGSNPELLIGQDYPRPTHLITLACHAALGLRDKLTINGTDYPTRDGSCMRDYIHVEDLANAHVRALDYLKDFNGSEVINVGTGVGSTVLEVVHALEEIAGNVPYEIGPRRPGDLVSQYADNTKAKKLLHWEAKYGLKDMIAHAYNWLKTYPNGYKDKTVAN